jgi:hypothetical protein
MLVVNSIYDVILGESHGFVLLLGKIIGYMRQTGWYKISCLFVMMNITPTPVPSTGQALPSPCEGEGESGGENVNIQTIMFLPYNAGNILFCLDTALCFFLYSQPYIKYDICLWACSIVRED